MADTSGLYTIGQIVRRILRKTNTAKKEYKHFFNLVVDGYIDLRLFHASEGIRTTEETIDTSIDAIDFPSDFIDLTSINVPLNGELWPLTNAPKMVNTTTGSPEERDSDEGEGVDIYRTNMPGYATTGAVNLKGYYYVDWEKRRILFTNLPSDVTQVILQYKTSGVSLTETTYIPVHYYPALEAYVMYQNARYTNPGVAREFERNYNIECKKLKYLTMPSASEFLDILRGINTPLSVR